MRPVSTARLAAVGVLLLTATACAGPEATGTTSARAGTAAPQVSTSGGTRPATATPRPSRSATPAPRATKKSSRPAGRPTAPARGGTKARPSPAPRPATTAGAGATLRGSGSWRRAFNGAAGAVSCGASLPGLKASSTPRLTAGRTTVFVGFQQFGNNQDPVLVRFDGDRKVYCRHHERQGPDGRALGITWDGGPTAYVVYTVVGGGTDLEAKAGRGWVRSYGNGGASSRVTVLAEVELRSGTVRRATFLVARVVKNGQPKTNTIVPVAAPLVTARGIAVSAKSAFSPLNPDLSLMCSGGSEYPAPGPGGASYVGVFASDLGSLTCARTWGCGNVRKPCPDVS